MEEKQTHTEEKTKEYKVTLSIEHNEHKTKLTPKQELYVLFLRLCNLILAIAYPVTFLVYIYFLSKHAWGKAILFVLLTAVLYAVKKIIIDIILKLDPPEKWYAGMTGRYLWV